MSEFYNKKIGDIITEYFPNKGTFVEVGAFDGETYSNTCVLADTKWRGIYIEPIKSAYLKCVKRHKDNDIEVLNVAVGDKIGEVTIYDNGVLSTSHTELTKLYKVGEFKKWFPWYKKGKVKKVPIVLLDSVLNETPNLLVVDVEGSELEVMKGYNGLPKMVILEMHEKSEPWQESEFIHRKTIELNELMLNKGYNKIYSDDTDTIYVK